MTAEMGTGVSKPIVDSPRRTLDSMVKRTR